jgi:AsmA-like protein
MGRGIRRTLIGLALAAALAVAAPFLVPITQFIPDLTRVASEKLGQPVTMEDLTLYLLPAPRIVGSRITVGKNAQVMIGELQIQPELLSLLSGSPRLWLIRAERVALDETALVIPRGMPKGGSGRPIAVRRVHLVAVKLNHSSIDVPLFDVDVLLGPGLRVVEARLETRDGSLKLRARPQGNDTTEVAATATNWTLPVGTPLLFETLALEGTLKTEQLELSRIEGLLYGGKVVGSARAEWGKQWHVSGKANLAGVDLVSVQQALGKKARLSGRLNADATFSTRAKIAAQLREGLSLDGPFEVLGGTYNGVDLSKAGDLTRLTTSGDATSFEELKGKMELRGELVRINELCVRSPKMVAGGNVEIAADRKLSGKLDISAARTGGFVGIPMLLGGTAEEPSLSPTKGYLIGAAIGTVFMPVIGTSIGSTLGSRIEGVSGCN